MKVDFVDLAFGLLSSTLISAGLVFASITPSNTVPVNLIRSDTNNFKISPVKVSEFEYLDTISNEKREIKIKKHDNLNVIFKKLGLNPDESQNAMDAFSKLVNIEDIKPGDRMTAYLKKNEDNFNLIGISFWPDKERQILLSKSTLGQWNSYEFKSVLLNKTNYIKGTIDDTLYSAIINQGADNQVVHSYADIFGYDIDFQREVHKGDQFEIVYETIENKKGELVKTGSILYAKFEGKSLTKTLYRYQKSDSKNYEYYDESGQSIKKFIMKTPINGARLSSVFGMRHHPILGYTRAHNGTDFAAPIGTPIYAGGDGTIVKANYAGSYGNYIMIRHNTLYSTAYAHLNKFAPGIRPGTKVQQGQIIGYVGTTGRSTGPHLHYEVYQRGVPISLSKLKSPEVKKLEGDELNKFINEKNRIDSLKYQRKNSIPNTSWTGLNDCFSRVDLVPICDSVENFLQKVSF